MKLHVFRCSNRQLRTCLTQDRTGGNLPVDACQNGNWIFWKTIDVNLGDSGRLGAPTAKEILDAILRDGYLISEAEIKFNEGTSRQ